MALTGIVLGWVALALVVIGVLFMVAYFAIFGAAILSSTGSTP